MLICVQTVRVHVYEGVKVCIRVYVGNAPTGGTAGGCFIERSMIHTRSGAYFVERKLVHAYVVDHMLN